MHGQLLFLIKYNGGRPVQDCFDSKNNDAGSVVDAFLGFRKERHLSIQGHIETYENRIPRELFPIAYDSFGNVICIGIKSEYYGKVYFWDHEWEAEESLGESPDFSNVTLIAENFDEFVEGLHEYVDDEE